ncbi:hypothetical protein [Paracoccus marcusii]|uniref:hypothetical protein n=1 Tax=Paracoccus marcusii TaxID=59779 RepID=UPI0039C867FD
MTRHLRNDGHRVNEKRIRRLMRLMPIYQKPNTGRPAWGHKTYPYLLRELPVERPNQVWRPDITPAGAAWRSAWPRTGDGSCLTLPHGDHGLAHAQGSILADLEHPGMRPCSPPVQEQGRMASVSRH